MATPNFQDILDRKPSEIEKPKPRPAGTYMAGVEKYELRDVDTKNGQRKVASFSCKIIAPVQVDDMEALNDQGDISAWFPLSRDIFYDSPEGAYGLKLFLTNTLGIDPGAGKNEKSIKEMLPEAPGRRLTVTLGHRPYVDRAGEPSIATEIQSVAAA